MSAAPISNPPVTDPAPVTDPPPVTDPAPITGWREGLDAEIQGHPALADIADVPALARSFIATKEMVGHKGIILPKEGDAVDIARFRKEIGVPETAEDYDLGDFTPPEGLPWDDSFQTAMLGKLHALGIPNTQIRQLFDDYAEVTHEQYSAMVRTQESGHEEGMKALRTELGAAYDSSIALSQRAFKAAAGENFNAVAGITLADGTQLGDNPAFIKTFINIGNQYQEHGLAGEKVGGGGFALTPESAKQELETIEANPNLWKEGHPEQKQLQARKNELAEMAFPEIKPEVL